jgi:hypothetical protein
MQLFALGQLRQDVAQAVDAEISDCAPMLIGAEANGNFTTMSWSRNQ